MTKGQTALLGLVLMGVGVLVAGNGFGLMMGDPGSPEAKEFQDRWSRLAFFVGCPFGIGLFIGGCVLLIRAISHRDTNATE